MMFVKVWVAMTLLGVADAVCTYTSWMLSFDSPGQSKCNELNHYIYGLERSDVHKDDQLFFLEGVHCCSAPPQWSKIEVQVVYADWTKTLDRPNQWAHCPAGFFLQGLQRSKSGKNKGYVYNIENGRCAKPANHPFYYGDCYSHYIDFSRSGLYSCNEGYYITGLYKADCDYLHCIDRLYCCKMADTPQVVDDPETLKTRIMDTTLWNLANLAAGLGYGWCSGTKGMNVGEDFYRSGDSWVADSRLFWPNKKCDGYKCKERLAIDYSGWTFVVKEIRYGESVIDELIPVSIDGGMRVNEGDSTVNATFERSQEVTETIVHSSTNSWKTSLELSFSVEVGLKHLAKASRTLKIGFDYSKSKTETKSNTKTDVLKATTTISIPPRSAAKCTVIVSKARTTIPYTAVVIARFNVGFRGFLRWGQGYDSPSTNYHSQHKGSGARPSVPYTFGDQSEAFYTALKRQSESQAWPWLWNEMLRNYPSVRHVINRLTDESQYEITLNGKLEHVSGTKIDIKWETRELNKNFNRRSETDDGKANTTQLNNGTFFATVGPNDKPVDVKYPEVELVNAEPFELDILPANQESS
ncbi:aerolysin-like [Biomphalaria glabrata]|uniref:Aerolysin-like n=1 Tax=Biomphalaria glabrata TaxID=6526 RepID=A0A9U8EDH3_BIOGL|nr:aerolysin-like [Biomphalaria glabrata]